MRPMEGTSSVQICPWSGSLAGDLVEYNARSRIFIRHYSILCSVRSLGEAKRKLRRSLGGSVCGILHVDFPELVFPEGG